MINPLKMEMHTMTSNLHFLTIRSRRLNKGSPCSRGAKSWEMRPMQGRNWALYYSQTWYCTSTSLSTMKSQRGALLECRLMQRNYSSSKSSPQTLHWDATNKDKPGERVKCQALLGNRALSFLQTRDRVWRRTSMIQAYSERRVGSIAKFLMISSACRESRVGVRNMKTDQSWRKSTAILTQSGVVRFKHHMSIHIHHRSKHSISHKKLQRTRCMRRRVYNRASRSTLSQQSWSPLQPRNHQSLQIWIQSHLRHWTLWSDRIQLTKWLMS